MKKEVEKVKETVAFLNKEADFNPEIGIILGTGLGNLATKIKVDKEIAYTDIPNFPEATVEYHSGKLIFGELAGKKVVAMQGRFHWYEGYEMNEIVFPVRVMKFLGVGQLLISNAAGLMNLDWEKGDLMLIDDHINRLPGSPLRGVNSEDFGVRFPDMSSPYDPKMNIILQEVAKEEGVNLRKGVYVAATGPQLETRAEYRELRAAGADAVGMSTVPEVIAANHIGLPCCAISVLTDLCDPDNLEPVNIDEIIAIAGKSEIKLTLLFERLIEKL